MNRTKIITLVTATALMLTLTSCQEFTNSLQEAIKGPEPNANNESEQPTRDTNVTLDTPEKAVEWLTEPTRGQEDAPQTKIYQAPYSDAWVVYLKKDSKTNVHPYTQEPTINDCAYVDSHSKKPTQGIIRPWNGKYGCLLEKFTDEPGYSKVQASLDQTVNDILSTVVEKIKQSPNSLIPTMLELSKTEGPVTYEFEKYDKYTTINNQAVVMRAKSKEKRDNSRWDEFAWYTPSLSKNILIIASTNGDVYYNDL